MGTHLRVLSVSYLMNTNMTGAKMVFKNLSIFVLWKKVVSALEGSGIKHKFNTVEHIYDACPKYSELGSFRFIAYLYVSDGGRR